MQTTTTMARRTAARAIALLGASALALAGCSLTDDLDQAPADPTNAATPAESAEPTATSLPDDDVPLVAVVSTTPLGSVVGQIAECGGGRAETIMGIGDDPHSFQPSSAQVAEMVNAPLIVISGMDLEGSLISAVESAALDGANVLAVGPLVDPLTFDETGGSHDHDGDGTPDHDDETHEHDSGYDPHWWLDASRMATAAALIGDALAEETGGAAFAECGAQLSEELLTLDAEITEILAGVKHRELVTDHQAFGYFATRYDFELIGAVIPSLNTDAEPSSADLAELVHIIEEHQVAAIFANVGASTALADAVAEEVGFDVQIVPLYTESLGPAGSGAETYQDMMRTNAHLIANALSVG